jgi:hypothetical protein
MTDKPWGPPLAKDAAPKEEKKSEAVVIEETSFTEAQQHCADLEGLLHALCQGHSVELLISPDMPSPSLYMIGTALGFFAVDKARRQGHPVDPQDQFKLGSLVAHMGRQITDAYAESGEEEEEDTTEDVENADSSSEDAPDES